MSDSAAVVFALLIFKRDDFRAFSLADHFTHDRAFVEVGQSHFRLFAVVNEQYFFKFNGSVCSQEFDVDFVPFFDSVLFSTGLDDSVHNASRYTQIDPKIGNLAKLALGYFHQAKPAPKQPIFFNMGNEGGWKGRDASAARNRFLDRFVYTIAQNITGSRRDCQSSMLIGRATLFLKNLFFMAKAVK